VRIKEQETRLTLREHDDDDDDNGVERNVPTDEGAEIQQEHTHSSLSFPINKQRTLLVGKSEKPHNTTLNSFQNAKERV